MSPNHRRKWTFAFWHHQIGGDDTTLRARIRDVVDSRVLAILDANLLHFDRRLSIVLKVTHHLGVLRDRVSCPERSNPDESDQLRNGKRSFHSSEILKVRFPRMQSAYRINPGSRASRALIFAPAGILVD